MTRAEARIASRLMSEQSLETVARELGIAYETARNQLKAVFAKTRTSRQCKLVAVLARLMTDRAS
jgi:DNA-binding CsgD family transcriptional regulator